MGPARAGGRGVVNRRGDVAEGMRSVCRVDLWPLEMGYLELRSGALAAEASDWRSGLLREVVLCILESSGPGCSQLLVVS